MIRYCRRCTSILYDDKPCEFCTYSLDSKHNLRIRKEWEERLQYGRLLVLGDDEDMSEENLLILRTTQVGLIVDFDPDVKEQIKNAMHGYHAVELAIKKKLKLPDETICILSCLNVS